MGKPKQWTVGRNGDVWVPEYETYPEKKWLERHGIRKDSIHMRETYSRIKDKQRGKHCSCKSAMKHLKEINMSWSMHLWYALTLAYRLFRLSLIAVVHGLLPFMFTSKVSDSINKLNEELS